MISTEYGFTNKEASNISVVPVKLNVTENYAITTDEPTECKLTNVTCPVDRGELLTYRCQKLAQVNTDQQVMYPAPVKDGIQYVIKIEDIVTTRSDTDPSYRVDTPIVAWLTIRHPRSEVVTDNMVAEVVTRLLGACYKSDGSTRFRELMRSALKPTED